MEDYLDALCKEISYVGDISKEKKLNTIYIGGGTPTTLEADQLDRLLTHLEETFSYEEIKEITVEAGRPDSITREKLEVLKRHKSGPKDLPGACRIFRENAGVGNPNGDPPDENRTEDVRRADGGRRDSENSHGTISDE